MVKLAMRGSILIGLALVLGAGCKKSEPAAPVATAAASDTQPQSTAPGPAPTPATPVVIAPADNGDVQATLAQLTRELHRTMVGRRLSGSFDEFVAIRNLSVPPPPAGKKYIITKQWRVDLADK
jgi:hypothetical protein